MSGTKTSFGTKLPAVDTSLPVVDNPPVADTIVEEPTMYYFHDARGAIYKAATKLNPGDSIILFPGPDIEQHMSKDAAGNIAVGGAAYSTTGIQSTTTASASGNTKVSISR